MAARKPISWRVRGLVMARAYCDGAFICNWCCARLSHDDVVIDHHTPVAAGGDNSPDNLTVSCSTCNAWKGAAHPEDAEEFINARLDALA